MSEYLVSEPEALRIEALRLANSADTPERVVERAELYLKFLAKSNDLQDV